MSILEKQKTILLVSLAILGLLLAVAVIKSSFPNLVMAPLGIKGDPAQNKDGQTETAEPFPFQELTIPYLKNRTYQSQLNDRQRVGGGPGYTNYLTGYSSDGLKINGLLAVPTGEMPEDGYPAVVFVHGYIPPTTYKTEQNYNLYVDYLARRGLVVFKIDLRGHDQSEGEAGGSYYSGDYVVDVLNAYSALQNSELVNPDKVGLWGHSMAGNVVLRAMAAYPTIPRVVIWAGAVYSYEDFRTLGISDNSYRPPTQVSERRRQRDELFATYGQFDPNSWFWRQVPATNYLDDIRGEIQIHHAVDDGVVSIEYSRGLAEALAKTTIPHQLFEYASGGHNLTGSAFSQAMQRSSEFYLK